jgi:hypothetical protein
LTKLLDSHKNLHYLNSLIILEIRSLKFYQKMINLASREEVKTQCYSILECLIFHWTNLFGT